MEDLREEIMETEGTAEAAAEAAGEAVEAAADAAGEAADAAQAAADEVKEAAGGAVGEPKETLADAAKKVIEKAAKAAAELADEAKEAVSKSAVAAAEFADEAKKTLTGDSEKAAETKTSADEAVPSESMDDYAAELEASFRQVNEGDILTGTVIGVTETDITLDLGYYTDGIIHLEDASDDPSFSLKDRIEVGQKLSATVVKRDDGAGHILLSMKEAAHLMAWDRLRALKESGENITVKITDTTKGGAIAYLEGVRGFIPASKLALSYVEEEGLKEYVGQSIEVRVIDADEETKHLVMSARDILWEKKREERTRKQEERTRKISDVEVGLVTEGTVETIKPYGAFVKFGDGLSGLLHVSQISQKRIKDPGEVLKEGDTVKVKVIANKDGKLSLSMKALEESPVEEVREEEKVVIPKVGNVTTSLGDLFAKLKL